MSDPVQCPISQCQLFFGSWEDLKLHFNDPFTECYRLRSQSAFDPSNSGGTLTSTHIYSNTTHLNTNSHCQPIPTGTHNYTPDPNIGPHFSNSGPTSRSTDIDNEPPLPPKITGSFQYHPSSGHLYGRQPNTLEKMDADENTHRRKNNIFYPFESGKEWELGKFLSEVLTQSQIDRYLKLQWVRSCPFTSH